jgi:hypothetical protein
MAHKRKRLAENARPRPNTAYGLSVGRRFKLLFGWLFGSFGSARFEFLWSVYAGSIYCGPPMSFTFKVVRVVVSGCLGCQLPIRYLLNREKMRKGHHDNAAHRLLIIKRAQGQAQNQKEGRQKRQEKNEGWEM